MSKVALLDAVAAWYDNHLHMAHKVGVDMTFGRTNDDRDKHSAWIEFECHGRLGEMIVWDSGEAEYMTGGETDPAVSEHHDIGDVTDVDLLLERLFSAVAQQHSDE